MANGKVTIKEIARRAEVSPSLVSHILNGKGRASEVIRAKVVGMLREAGYKPKYSRKPIYYIMDFPISPIAGQEHAMRQLAGVQSLLDEEGCTLLVEFLPAAPDDMAIEAMFERIAQRKPGGVCFTSGAQGLPIAAKIFSAADIPLVQAGFDIEFPGVTAVVVDSFAGAYLAVQYLAKRGHTRIATIRWPAPLILNSNRKHAGYLAALADAGIPIHKEYIRDIGAYTDGPTWMLARNVLEEMLALPEPPTALFVENSYISESLLYPQVADGGTIPEACRRIETVHFEDLSLDALEHSMASKMSYPPRDTCFITIDWYNIGRTAARVMIDSIKGVTGGPGRIVKLTPILQKVNGPERIEIQNGPGPASPVLK